MQTKPKNNQDTIDISLIPFYDLPSFDLPFGIPGIINMASFNRDFPLADTSNSLDNSDMLNDIFWGNSEASPVTSDMSNATDIFQNNVTTPMDVPDSTGLDVISNNQKSASGSTFYFGSPDNSPVFPADIPTDMYVTSQPIIRRLTPPESPDIFENISCESASFYCPSGENHEMEEKSAAEDRKAAKDLEELYMSSASSDEEGASDICWANCTLCKDTFFDFYTIPCTFCKGPLCDTCFEKCAYIQVVENRINYIRVQEGGYLHPFSKLYLVCGPLCHSNMLGLIQRNQ